MRLLSWNVQHLGDGERVARTVERIRSVSPDVVALQEIEASAETAVRAQLTKIGLGNMETLHAALHVRGSNVLVASHWPLQPLDPTHYHPPADEVDFYRDPTGIDGEVVRLLSILIERPGAPFEVHCTHVPPGSDRGWRKIDAFRGIHQRLAVPSPVPRILCGDFNEPRSEDTEGNITTWGDPGGNQHAGVARERWSAAVLAVLRGLAAHDLPDAVRAVHREKTAAEWSHLKGGKRRRYDHAFASTALGPVRAEYLHDGWTGKGLSDHAALLVEFGAGV